MNVRAFSVCLAVLLAGAVPTLAQLPGQIVVDPDDPSWLSYHGGGSFFLCAPGEPEGFLYRGTQNGNGTRDGDQQALINKLAPTGSNGIYLMAVRSHGGDGDATQNPFVDNDPDLGLNQAVLDQWEGWFSSMDQAGIVIYFFFYDDSARIWGSEGNFNTAKEKAFVHGLVNRFEHHKHLIWVIAEEYSENWQASEVRKLADFVRGADNHDHPIAVHQLSGLDFDFPSYINIDQFAIQYNESNTDQVHDGMLTAWSNADGRYNLNLSEAAGWGDGALSRRNAWAAAMGGAYVMQIEWDIASTPIARLKECGYLRNFFEEISLAGMQPMDSLALGSTDYVLADPGTTYVAYADDSGALGVADLPAGQPVQRWLDTVSGQVEIRIEDLPGGDTFLQRPGGLGDEVAVHLDYEGGTMFSDGFDSGNTVAWSETVP